jgi:hypothetical protein
VGQIEIYELLKNRRSAGDDRFFTVPQIRKMLRASGKAENSFTGLQASKLEAWGYLEWKRVSKRSDHWRAYRIKSEYIEK